MTTSTIPRPPARPPMPLPATTAARSTVVPGFEAPPPSRTPRLLRQLQVAVVLAVLLAGAVAAWVVHDLRDDLASAPNLAQQYARLAQVQHSLSDAADLAARSVLAGEGSDGANANASASQASTALGLLLDAARDRPQDSEKLKALSAQVLQYSQDLHSATGLPREDAAPGLRSADERLQPILTSIDELHEQLSTEAADRPWSQGTPAVVIVGVAVIAGLLVVSWVLARRSHRFLNLGLGAALLAVAIILGTCGGAQAAAATASLASRTTQFGKVVTAASLTRQVDAADHALSTAALTHTWNASAKGSFSTARSSAAEAASGLKTSFTAFSSAADTVSDHLASSQWGKATTAVLAEDSDSLLAATNGLLAKAGSASDRAVDIAATAPRTARDGLMVDLALVICLALAGALAAGLGLQQRLREYR